ncbi:MAG: phosphoenolpyruvate--protein phosphotransferase [Gemmatimonadota bacterium]
MSRRILGIGASPGRAIGVARRVEWDLPAPPHRTIAADQIESEIERFHAARAWARAGLEELRDRTRNELGDVEAKIFDPQILILEDPELVSGTVSYIRDSFLPAERAFDWRIMELRMQILDAAHLMLIDRLADLRDVRFRVLSRLEGRGDDPFAFPTEPAVLAFDDLTPSLAARLDPSRVLGLISAAGSRTAHSAVLARSMGIPAVVGVGASLSELEDGQTVLLDGGTGKIVLEPSESEVQVHRRMMDRLSDWTERVSELTGEPLATFDGERVHLRANLDQPDDVTAARRVGAEGVGLFRTEFLVIGRRVIPSEDEQFEAYRRVVEAFPDHAVTLRTFDIGGDKFPLFLEMPPEENPYLGWRAIRVCLDLPDLFRNQLRAATRAGRDDSMRVLIPFVISTDEVRRTRDILDEVVDDLGPRPHRMPLGIMIETPAAVDTLDLLAPQLDFVSLGTNDLTQYVLAVDRGNARLAHLADPLHPALVRQYARLRRDAAEAGLAIGVCGDLAADPIGLALLIGLGYRDFSLSPSSIPEVRELVRLLSANELARLCDGVESKERVLGVRSRLGAYLADAVPFDTTSIAS